MQSSTKYVRVKAKYAIGQEYFGKRLEVRETPPERRDIAKAKGVALMDNKGTWLWLPKRILEKWIDGEEASISWQTVVKEQT